MSQRPEYLSAVFANIFQHVFLCFFFFFSFSHGNWLIYLDVTSIFRSLADDKNKNLLDFELIAVTFQRISYKEL